MKINTEIKISEISYLKSVFEDSLEFKNAIKNIRSNYKIKLEPSFTNRKNRRFIILRIEKCSLAKFTQAEIDIKESFDKDINELCNFFVLNRWRDSVRYYVLTGVFKPLHLHILELRENSITFFCHPTVTKKDWEKAWKMIADEKKTRYFERDICCGEKPVIRRKSRTCIDRDLWLYKKYRDHRTKIPQKYQWAINDIDAPDKSYIIKQFKEIDIRL